MQCISAPPEMSQCISIPPEILGPRDIPPPLATHPWPADGKEERVKSVREQEAAKEKRSAGDMFVPISDSVWLFPPFPPWRRGPPPPPSRGCLRNSSPPSPPPPHYFA